MYNYDTSNQSFIDLHNRLKNIGISNNEEFLLLNNENLVGVDPWDENISEHEKAEIIQECNDNIWYFLREVIRLPQKGTALLNTIVHSPFYINIGVFAMIFLWLNGFNQFTCMPADMFKTGTICALYSYLRNIFGLSISNLNISGSNNLSSQNIKYNIRHYSVPSYLKSGIDAGNLEKHTLLDDFVNIKDNKTLWNKVRDKNNLVLLSTAGDLSTKSGKFAHGLKGRSIPWKNEYFDAKKEYLESIYDASSDKLFYVEYNLEDLLVDPDTYYKSSKLNRFCEDPDIIARKVDLLWK
ncbi:MAG: hypothetical protein IKR19_08575 [Acholeplasmatales bacterium]|nr:hypothetical protein [Acholeplasmatales bacterium]